MSSPRLLDQIRSDALWILPLRNLSVPVRLLRLSCAVHNGRLIWYGPTFSLSSIHPNHSTLTARGAENAEVAQRKNPKCTTTHERNLKEGFGQVHLPYALVHELLGHKEVSTTMIYTHSRIDAEGGVKSPSIEFENNAAQPQNTNGCQRWQPLLVYKMVGTTGFEPATSRTPSVRATRLRHVPLRTSSIRAKL